MYIPRHLESVIKRIEKKKSVLVLTGPRQVGKTTMLKTTHQSINYISMNRPLVRESAEENPSLFFETYKPPVIVDEIQKAGALFEYIKDIVDKDKSKGQFYLTGSQSLKLMKNVGESLAGRAGVVKMLGLSTRELDGVAYQEPFSPTLTHIESMRDAVSPLDYHTVVERVHKGFFPELYEFESSLKDWSDFYSSYFQTYIEKDIKDLLNIRDESAFIKCVRAVAALSGQMLNYSTIAEICGKDVNTVKAWISVLEASGLVYLLEPYYNNFNKRLVKTPKLYFLDTGLACWLTGWNTPEQLLNGAMWGHYFETYAVTEILKSYYNDGVVNPSLYYYRDKEKNEIDLLIEEAGTLYPIEIKTSSDPTKQMAKAFNKLDAIPGKSVGEGAIVCLAKDPLPLMQKVTIVPVNLI